MSSSASSSGRPSPEPRQLGPVQVFFGDRSGKYPDGNQVVVTGADSKVVFDAPLSTARSDAPCAAAVAGADLAILGHIHEDHTAGLGRFADVPVLAPRQDVAALQSLAGMLRHYGYREETNARMAEKIQREFHYRPRPDALGYAPDTVWELGGGVSVRAVHMPGHTGGHSVLLVEPGPVAFIGDIDLSGFGPYYADACSDLAQFRETLHRMEHLPAQAWITFHHKGVITERETYLHLLRAFRDKIEQRDAAICAALEPPGKTLAELAAQRFLYPPGYQDVYVEDAERMCLQQHLAGLLAAGTVREEGGVYRRAA